MKKILFTIIIVISLLIFCGCENKDKGVVIVETPGEFLGAIDRYNYNNGRISATHIALANDLDFSGYTWPLGLDAGKIDGRGHTIKNITIEVSEGKRIAMFNQINQLVNINIENLNITYYGKDALVGGVAVYHNAYRRNYFENIKISGSIYAPSASCVGGLITCAYQNQYPNVEDNTFHLNNIELDIDITGGSYVGGAIGSICDQLYLGKENARSSYHRQYVSFNNVTNKGNITAKGSFVGGLVGAYYDKAGSIDNCKNYGTIKGDSYVGGLVGDALLSDCKNSENNGEIICSGKNDIEIAYIGGIAGRIGCTEKISKCNNTTNIECKKPTVGGIAGYVVEKTKLVECTNSGNITALDEVGGIAGSANNSSEFILCENKGEITGTNDSWRVGGIVGNAFNCFVNMCTNSAKITSVLVAGGIVGNYNKDDNNNDGAVIGSTNSGNVIATSAGSYAGGIIGKMSKFDMIELNSNINLGKIEGNTTVDIANVRE